LRNLLRKKKEILEKIRTLKLEIKIAEKAKEARQKEERRQKAEKAEEARKKEANEKAEKAKKALKDEIDFNRELFKKERETHKQRRRLHEIHFNRSQAIPAGFSCPVCRGFTGTSKCTTCKGTGKGTNKS